MVEAQDFLKMYPLKIKLNFIGMQILFAELPSHEMEAMYFMMSGKEMPNKITKADLTNIIAFLCNKLKWIEFEEPVKEEMGTNSSTIAGVEQSTFTNEDISAAIDAKDGKTPMMKLLNEKVKI